MIFVTGISEDMEIRDYYVNKEVAPRLTHAFQRLRLACTRNHASVPK